MPFIRFVKFTAQVDVASLAEVLFPKGVPHILYSTYVEYDDDPTTQAIFQKRASDFNSNGNIVSRTNDPHSLAAIANDDHPEDCAIILDGLHFLTSNLMLLTNSDEVATEVTAEKLINDELTLLDALQYMDLPYITVISADVSADTTMRQTFQGKTYQKLLGITNRTATERLRNPAQYVALSAGLIPEYRV